MNPEQIESIATKYSEGLMFGDGVVKFRLNQALAQLAKHHENALTELDESHKAELEAKDAEIERLEAIERNRDEALAAKRKYVSKCNHCPELVIDSEDGPICCECWALDMESTVKEVRESIANFLPADANIEERCTLSALNAVFQLVQSLRAQLAETKAKLAEAEKERENEIHRIVDEGLASAKRDANEWHGKWDQNQTEKINLRAQLLAQQGLNAKLREALKHYERGTDYEVAQTALALPFDQTLMNRICEALDEAVSHLSVYSESSDFVINRIKALLAELRPETK